MSLTIRLFLWYDSSIMILKGSRVNSPYRYKNLESVTDEILDFKKLNIFVGANNSGKSRFMRSVFLSDLKNKFTEEDAYYFKKLSEIYEGLSKTYPKDVFSMNDLKNLLVNKYYDDFIGKYFLFLESLKTTANSNNGYSTISGSAFNDVQLAKIVLASIQESDLISNVNKKVLNSFKSIYIPMLRGVRNYEGHGDLYSEKISSDYFKDENKNLIDLPSKNKEIFSGLGIYDKVKNMLLGNKIDRTTIGNYQSFLRENFFENSKELTLIPKPNEKVINVDIGNHKDRAIYDVGDGIQSMIINTFPAFENQNEKTILFIEEPEMTMHPSMQRTLLETLLKFPKLQVFVTTHSNHFLDLVYDFQDDISVYSFEENSLESDISNGSSFLIKNITNNSKILDILGVRNSSVFLANSVIWVEGVTDRMLLRKLFEVFGFDKKYKEDYDYAISEFGGGNIDNFDFSLEEELSDSHKINVYGGLSKNNFIILDNDIKIKKTDAKNLKRDYLKKIVGEDNLFDEYPEIENIIGYKIWVELLPELLNKSRTIKMKDNFNNKEKEFNDMINISDIGDVMRKLFIKSADITINKFSRNSFALKKDITCLGFTKKEIMLRVLDKIKDKKDFTPSAESLFTSLDLFVSRVKNKTFN